MNHDRRDDDDAARDPDAPPSRSARKRAAEDAQRLGERLVELSEANLDSLPLPESLRDAIREARRIHSRAAGARQRQYIGKLMRDVDIDAVLAVFAARDRERVLEAERHKRAEHWRDRLLREGRAALDSFTQLCPTANRERLASLVATATRDSTAQTVRAAATRDLLRAVRTAFETPRAG